MNQVNTIDTVNNINYQYLYQYINLLKSRYAYIHNVDGYICGLLHAGNV